MPPSKKRSDLPGRKISETLLRFAGPLLEALDSDATESQMEEPLMVAWTIWNAVVWADAVADRRCLEEVRRSAAVRDPALATFMEVLIERKRRLFGDDHRLIGEYRLIRVGGEIRLQADARDPRRTV